MCDPVLSAGVTQDWRSGVDWVGATVAHEMGHLLNMNHDDGSKYIHIF